MTSVRGRRALSRVSSPSTSGGTTTRVGWYQQSVPNRLGGLLAFMPKAPDTTLQACAVALSLSGQTDEIGSSLDISSCVSCTGSAKHECHHVVTDRRRSRRHTWLHPPGRSRQGTVLHLL
jgi:hypothetical protein